eukprot:2116751-Amphidinium_carterae.1
MYTRPTGPLRRGANSSLCCVHGGVRRLRELRSEGALHSMAQEEFVERVWNKHRHDSGVISILAYHHEQPDADFGNGAKTLNQRKISHPQKMREMY